MGLLLSIVAVALDEVDVTQCYLMFPVSSERGDIDGGLKDRVEKNY